MTRSFIALALVWTLLLAAVTGPGAPPALADDTDTDGTFTTTKALLTNTRQVGTDTVNELNGEIRYTGRLTGTSVIRGDLIFHADGTASFYDIETFTGTVDGVAGVVTFYTSGGSEADGRYRGTEIVVAAADGLAGLTGRVEAVGAVLGPQGPAGTYTADFDMGNPNENGK